MSDGHFVQFANTDTTASWACTCGANGDLDYPICMDQLHDRVNAHVLPTEEGEANG